MKKGGKEKPPSLAESKPDAFVKGQARRYVRDVGNAKKAYDAHGGLKVLVRYEDLSADTLQTMKRIYSELEMPVEEAELARSVEKIPGRRSQPNRRARASSTARRSREAGGKI